MESRVNYTLVGIFVTVLSIGLVFFAYWLGKYGLKEDNIYYLAYMKESVSGLSPQASVKYRGVDVGVVEKIRINPQNSEEVELLLKVKKGTPIKEDMTVTLKFYGMTGLAFVEIEGGSSDSALLVSKNGEIPIIRSSPSIYVRLDETLSKIALKVSAALDNLNKLLSEKNLKNTDLILEDIKEITKNIKNKKEDFDKLLKEGIALEKRAILAFEEMEKASGGIKEAASSVKKDIKTAVDKIAQVSKEVDRAVKNVDTTLQRGDYNIKEMAAPTLEEIDEMIYEIKVLLSQMQRAVSSIEESPSDLLFKSSKKRLGPGERE